MVVKGSTDNAESIPSSEYTVAWKSKSEPCEPTIV